MKKGLASSKSPFPLKLKLTKKNLLNYLFYQYVQSGLLVPALRLWHYLRPVPMVTEIVEVTCIDQAILAKIYRVEER